MHRKNFLAAGIIIGLTLTMVGNSQAYEYSQAYYDCMSNPQMVSQVELNCIKEENVRVLRRLDETQKKLEATSIFSGLATTGNTLSLQRENFQKYIKSFCVYSASTECPDYKDTTTNNEKCMLKFNAVLLEAWQDLLKAVQKKIQNRW